LRAAEVATIARDRERVLVVVGEWSATPDCRACTSAPPSSSAVTTSPVAAFTSGGPPRKIVPWLRTMTSRRSSPARRRRRRCTSPSRGDLRDAGAPTSRLVVEDAAEVLAVGEDLVLQRQERAAGVDQVDARQPVLRAISCARRCFFTVIG
jgi:hypothetical protein